MKALISFFAVRTKEQAEVRNAVISFILLIVFIGLVVLMFVWFADKYAHTLK